MYLSSVNKFVRSCIERGADSGLAKNFAQYMELLGKEAAVTDLTKVRHVASNPALQVCSWAFKWCFCGVVGLDAGWMIGAKPAERRTAQPPHARAHTAPVQQKMQRPSSSVPSGQLAAELPQATTSNLINLGDERRRRARRPPPGPPPAQRGPPLRCGAACWMRSLRRSWSPLLPASAPGCQVTAQTD